MRFNSWDSAALNCSKGRRRFGPDTLVQPIVGERNSPEERCPGVARRRLKDRLPTPVTPAPRVAFDPSRAGRRSGSGQRDRTPRDRCRRRGRGRRPGRRPRAAAGPGRPARRRTWRARPSPAPTSVVTQSGAGCSAARLCGRVAPGCGLAHVGTEAVGADGVRLRLRAVVLRGAPAGRRRRRGLDSPASCSAAPPPASLGRVAASPSLPPNPRAAPGRCRSPPPPPRRRRRAGWRPSTATPGGEVGDPRPAS